MLEHLENFLETGIEIVQPPGKKKQYVSLFSGGAKVITAIARVYAFYLIKPGPFCLLDGIEAFLDDVILKDLSIW